VYDKEKRKTHEGNTAFAKFFKENSRYLSPLRDTSSGGFVEKSNQNYLLDLTLTQGHRTSPECRGSLV